MSEDDPKKAVETPPRCSCPVGNIRHFKHHQLADEMIDFFARLKEVRWFAFKALVIAGMFMLLGIFGVGLLAKAAKLLGMPPP